MRWGTYCIDWKNLWTIETVKFLVGQLISFATTYLVFCMENSIALIISSLKIILGGTAKSRTSGRSIVSFSERKYDDHLTTVLRL